MARMFTGMLFGIGAILLCGTPGRNATADPKLEEKQATRIALVDMAKIFKNSRIFEKKRAAAKEEIGDTEELVKSMYNSLLQMKNKLDQLDKRAEERGDLEEKWKRKAAEYEKSREEAKRKFLKVESEIYLEIYEIVTAEVANYAREHAIDLVIRFNAEPLEKDDPAKLLNSMNRQVVYENGLDITDEIIAAIN